MPARCDKCGLVAPDDRLMHKYWHGPTGEPQLFCPACWGKRQEHTQKLEARFLAGMIVVIAIGAALAPAEHGGALGRLALGIVLVEAAAVFLHESGHAAAAWAMGMKVFKFSIGMGRNLYRRRFGDTEIEINLLPTCGYVLPGDRSLSLSRVRHLVVTFCGPAVNIGLAAVGFAMVGDDWATEGRGIDSITVFHLMAAINAFIAVVNLVPMMYPTGHDDLGPATQPNDGMLMLMTLLARGAVFRRWVSQSVGYQVHDRLRRDDAEGALAAAREGVERYPDVPAVRLVLADTLGRLGRHAEARAQIDAVLDRDDVDEATRVMGECTLAELIVDAGEGGDAGTLAEADRATDHAMRVAGAAQRVRLIRGRVLVATGWVAKGCQILHALLGESPDPQFAAECACAMARAELAQRDPDKARHYMDLARSLDDKCHHLAALGR